MSGNIFKRGDVWWGRVQVARRDIKKSLRTRDRAEAKRRLAAWLKEINAATFYGDARLKWIDAVTRFVQDVMHQSVKPATAKRYEVSFRQVDPFLSDLYVDEINRKKLADMIGKRKVAGASNATINRDLTAISAVLDSCIEWGACEGNAALTINRKRLTRERRAPIRPPTEEEIDALVAVSPPMVANIIRFLQYTGMRQEEAVSLEWSQVDERRREVSLYETKTSRPRVVTLDDAAAGTLAGTVRKLNCPYVFWHDTADGQGDRYWNFASRFAALARKAEVGFRCHDLRHKFAIDWLKAGGDIYRLSRHLGHSSVKTTEIYLGYAGTNPGTCATVLTAESEAT